MPSLLPSFIHAPHIFSPLILFSPLFVSSLCVCVFTHFSFGLSIHFYLNPFFVPSLSPHMFSSLSLSLLFLSGLSSVPPSQIIQDRVDSHVSRSRLLWNTLPGGLYALPQYSTDPAQFPFYYAILGKS